MTTLTDEEIEAARGYAEQALKLHGKLAGDRMTCEEVDRRWKAFVHAHVDDICRALLATRPAGPGLVALPEKMPESVAAAIRAALGVISTQQETREVIWNAVKRFGSAPSTLVPLPEFLPPDVVHSLCTIIYSHNGPGFTALVTELYDDLRSRFSQPAAGAITQEKVDRVAAAIANADAAADGTPPWEHLPEGLRVRYRCRAVAALCAKEPT